MSGGVWHNSDSYQKHDQWLYPCQGRKSRGVLPSLGLCVGESGVGCNNFNIMSLVGGGIK